MLFAVTSGLSSLVDVVFIFLFLELFLLRVALGARGSSEPESEGRESTIWALGANLTFLVVCAVGGVMRTNGEGSLSVTELSAEGTSSKLCLGDCAPSALLTSRSGDVILLG